ncbi:MAG: alanine--tRNA ligase [Clostridia bacterium]|nr:alanine--tRNA ligase [Clostridia bacterium]
MPRAAAEIRRAFLSFFAERGHEVVPSSSLVPEDDPTLLFTNAGMVQFKDVFTGRRRVPYKRAVTAQKCVRAGGKHNDLESVGRTARHHTFFEMLGNFSFGDYFKREAIGFAWEFVTGTLGLPADRLWATVFREDDEAARLWQEVAGLPPDRIVRLGEKDNFWAMGDTGPCGPCSEIHYDRGPEHRCQAPRCAIGACDCDRWLEIWNLVFMQFERDASGRLTPLPRPSVDTGMGLERIASVMQGVASNWETDLFRPIIAAVERLSGRTYDPGPAGFPFRVVADHARTTAFLVADGVLPSNEGRGYVLRRILRRAARLGRRLGFRGPFLGDVVPTVVALMGEAYPELAERQAFVREVVREEEARFEETLDRGMALLDEIVRTAKAEGRSEIRGEEAFRLYDTFGFPPDLVADAAEEAGLRLDAAGFEKAMAEQRERARRDRQAKLRRAGGSTAGLGLPATRFVGYDSLVADAEVLAVVGEEGAKDEAAAGEEALVVLDRTPLYAEAGGQVADTGELATDGGFARVLDVRREGDLYLHAVRVERGSLRRGARVRAQVDAERRLAVARNHTATHLLHAALRRLLGPDATQAGSLVAPDRLRFDFAAPRPLSPEEVQRVEDTVNGWILDDLPVVTRVMPLARARAEGALALFGEKYGEEVRVVGIGDVSLELCGGTHLASTAEVGPFRIRSESGVGSGVRRIEALTGRAALAAQAEDRDRLLRLAELLRVPVEGVVARAEELALRLAEAERELAALRAERAAEAARRLAEAAEPVGEGRVVVAEVEAKDARELGALADDLRARLGSGGAVLAARSDGRVLLLASFTPDFVRRGAHAGRLVASAAREVGGGGGGRADFAQAGGRDPSRIREALARAREELARQLGAS